MDIDLTIQDSALPLEYVCAVYDGEWVYDRRHGLGTMTNPNGIRRVSHDALLNSE